MGASPEEEQPVLPRHGANGGSSGPDEVGEAAGSCACCAWSCIVLALIFAFGWYVYQSCLSPEYSVAITGVSGLSPATDQQQGGGVLNPVFNLTVGVASPSALGGACIGAGTTVMVSYSHLRIPLAGGLAPETCAGPRQRAEPRTVVARGHDVAVPGFVVDALAAEETKPGNALFEVKLTDLEDDQWKEVTCWARVGDAGAAALNVPCTERWGGISSMPGENSGYVVPYPVPADGHGPH
ncbi:hypothetical protein ACP4OV_006241 [Aristida adscensionis]